ncbi:hypothetical protein [Streptomyces sp. NPDC002690]
MVVLQAVAQRRHQVVRDGAGDVAVGVEVGPSNEAATPELVVVWACGGRLGQLDPVVQHHEVLAEPLHGLGRDRGRLLFERWQGEVGLFGLLA